MHTEHRNASPAALQGAPHYQGPERRKTGPPPAAWLMRMLDEVDYGALMLGEGGLVHWMNHAARAALAAGQPLQLDEGGSLRARDADDGTRLHAALMAARNGQRRLVLLGRGAAAVSLAVAPLGAVAPGGARATLLLMGRRQMCAALSLQLFARCHALTPSETRVLQALCEGLEPRTVARHCDIALTTVRTHIGAIRGKVGARGIREVLQRVATLPPLVMALRGNV
ncbi:MAG: LuxR C-terminal-related transcriptional regulator [Rubrivivax sp.]